MDIYIIIHCIEHFVLNFIEKQTNGTNNSSSSWIYNKKQQIICVILFVVSTLNQTKCRRSELFIQSIISHYLLFLCLSYVIHFVFAFYVFFDVLFLLLFFFPFLDYDLFRKSVIHFFSLWFHSVNKKSFGGFFSSLFNFIIIIICVEAFVFYLYYFVRLVNRLKHGSLLKH